MRSMQLVSIACSVIAVTFSVSLILFHSIDHSLCQVIVYVDENSKLKYVAVPEKCADPKVVVLKGDKPI